MLNRQGTQQQRPDSPTVTPHGMHVNAGYMNSTQGTFFEETPLVEFSYLVFTGMPCGVTAGNSGLWLCPLSVECYSLPLLVELNS